MKRKNIKIIIIVLLLLLIFYYFALFIGFLDFFKIRKNIIEIKNDSKVKEVSLYRCAEVRANLLNKYCKHIYQGEEGSVILNCEDWYGKDCIFVNYKGKWLLNDIGFHDFKLKSWEKVHYKLHISDSTLDWQVSTLWQHNEGTVFFK